MLGFRTSPRTLGQAPRAQPAHAPTASRADVVASTSRCSARAAPFATASTLCEKAYPSATTTGALRHSANPSHSRKWRSRMPCTAAMMNTAPRSIERKRPTKTQRPPWRA
ncbi:hypothetical protein [Myxococcus sp. CA018]|uniref:hypothetical protein n=1 Tax=Myxococcus sp. CA018 TaxID=2651864 RepID=UPI001F08FBBC|nr:hypothetical protein [Myxococcus sp. CA018]